MSQTFVAETVANFKQDNINQMTDLNTLRSNFSGTIFPTDAVAGQTCYRTDENKEYQFNGTTWVESNSNSTIAKEVELSKGTLESVSDRLDVSLNKDGTLKTNIVANISEFIISPLTVSFVSSTSFTVSDDQTSVFTTNRKLMMQLATDYVYSNVLSSVYDSETNKTTVTIVDSVLTAEVKQIAYSVIQKTDAKSIVNVPSGNVSSTTIQDAINELDNEKLGINDNAVSASKLAVAKKINNVPFDGSTDIKINSSTPGIKDYIVSGLKFGTPDGFNLPIQAGEANVNGTDAIAVDQTLTSSPRKKSLVYLKSDGVVDKLEAKYPTDYIDNNTVGFWIFNQSVGSVVPNSAVGLSSIAVANDLTPSGTFTRVDGLSDYAIKGDGSTAFFTSANYTGFPIGAAEREISILWTAKTAADEFLFNFGSLFLCEIVGTRIKFNNGSTAYDTTYDFVDGQDLLITFSYSGAVLTVSINGIAVYSLTITLATTAMLLTVLKYNSYFCNGTIHFLEIRNKCRTPQQIAEIAAKLLFPICYDMTPESLETTGTATGTLTSGGGLSAVFSGSTSKTYANSAQAPSAGGTGNIGMSWESAKKINSVTICGTSDYGYDGTGSASTITLTLQGSNNGGNTWDTLDSTSSADSAGLTITLTNNTGRTYSTIKVTISSTATTAAISVARMLFSTDTERKSLKDQLPADSISLGYAYAGSNGITDLNDSWWGYGRREKAYGGNRVVTQNYKPVVVQNPSAMQWTQPFGNGAKYKVDWRSAENANGMNDVEAAKAYYVSTLYGVYTANYKNGKIGANVGTGGASFVNETWRTGGYIRPIFTCLEDD